MATSNLETMGDPLLESSEDKDSSPAAVSRRMTEAARRTSRLEREQAGERRSDDSAGDTDIVIEKAS
mgnify:CR=1 FL=1